MCYQGYYYFYFFTVRMMRIICPSQIAYYKFATGGKYIQVHTSHVTFFTQNFYKKKGTYVRT